MFLELEVRTFLRFVPADELKNNLVFVCIKIKEINVKSLISFRIKVYKCRPKFQKNLLNPSLFCSNSLKGNPKKNITCLKI